MSKFPYEKSRLYTGITPTNLLLIYVKKYKWRVGIILVAVLFGEICATGNSYLVKSIVDTLTRVSTGQADIITLYILVGAVPLLGLLANIGYRISGYTAVGFFPYIRRDVRVDFFSYLHTHTHRYFSNHFGGALTNKITTAGRACDDILGTVSWDIIPSMVNIILSLVLLFLANTIIGWVTLLIIIVYMAIFYPFLKRVRKLSAITSEARSASVGKIADVITNIWNLQSHARAQYEERHLVEVFEEE